MSDMSDAPHNQRSFPNGPRPLGQSREFILPMSGMIGIDMWDPFVSSMQAWTRQMTQFNTSLQREWMAFIEKRLKQDAALTQQLADCQGPDDVVRTYSEFMRTAFEDYQQEFATFAKIGGSMASETVGMMQAGESETDQPGLASHRSSVPSPSARKRQGSAAGTEH